MQSLKLSLDSGAASAWEYYKASVLEKIDDLLDRLERVASKIFIVDYLKAV